MGILKLNSFGNWSANLGKEALQKRLQGFIKKFGINAKDSDNLIVMKKVIIDKETRVLLQNALKDGYVMDKQLQVLEYKLGFKKQPSKVVAMFTSV